MSVACEPIVLGITVDLRTRNDHQIGLAVRAMLGTQTVRLPERRREQRFPFPYPIRLRPVSVDGEEHADGSIFVLGKHISEHGLDFYYREPVAYRRVIVSFERAGKEVLHLLMDLTWCRFGRHGWYENGGRFLQLIATTDPLAELASFSSNDRA